MSEARLLLEQAKAGDMAAYEQVYQLFVTPVFRYIYARVGHKQQAEDLTQNVFLKVLNNIQRIKTSEGELLAYFFTVARNIVIDHWRKKKDVSFNDEMFASIENDFAVDQIDKGFSALELKKLLKELSEEQHTAIILKYLQGYSNAEIAKIMNKSEDAIRQIQSRGIKKLREILNNE